MWTEDTDDNIIWSMHTVRFSMIISPVMDFPAACNTLSSFTNSGSSKVHHLQSSFIISLDAIHDYNLSLYFFLS